MVETTAVFLPARTEFLDLGHFRLPVGETERRVVDQDVFLRNALGNQVGFQNLVGRARIDIVGAFKHETLDAFGVHQIIDGRDGLLVRGSAGIEDVARGFLTLVLNRVEQDRIQLFEHRQDRLARRRRPATEHGCDLVDGDQFTGLFGKERPVGGGIDNDGLKLLAEKAALLVLLFDEHQHGILERRLGDGHGAGQRMQNADLDRVFGSLDAGKCCRGQRASQERAQDLGFVCHV